MKRYLFNSFEYFDSGVCDGFKTLIECVLLSEKWHFGVLKCAVILFFNMHGKLILLGNSFCFLIYVLLVKRAFLLSAGLPKID